MHQCRNAPQAKNATDKQTNKHSNSVQTFSYGGAYHIPCRPCLTMRVELTSAFQLLIWVVCNPISVSGRWSLTEQTGDAGLPWSAWSSWSGCTWSPRRLWSPPSLSSPPPSSPWLSTTFLFLGSSKRPENPLQWGCLTYADGSNTVQIVLAFSFYHSVRGVF